MATVSKTKTAVKSGKSSTSAAKKPAPKAKAAIPAKGKKVVAKASKPAAKGKPVAKPAAKKAAPVAKKTAVKKAAAPKKSVVAKKVAAPKKAVTPVKKVASSPKVAPKVTKTAPKAAKEPKAVKGGFIEQEKLRDLVKQSLEDNKAEDMVTFDLIGRSSIADYVVVATGRSSRQVAAMAEHLRAKLLKVGIKQVRVEGLPQADWVIVDGGDVIAHLFRPEVRTYYNIEEILDAKSPHTNKPNA